MTVKAPLAASTPGLWRRRVLIGASGPRVRAAVEDRLHRFRLEAVHQDGQVVAASGQTFRAPTPLCPDAAQRLDALVGLRIDGSPLTLAASADARLQCTHLFDLAGLALAAAVRGVRRRIYEADVLFQANSAISARLTRDGRPLIFWRLDGSKVTDPEPYAGVDLVAGFSGWVARTLSGDEAEAALLFRRAINVGRGARRYGDGPLPAHGGCWVLQPERASCVVRSPPPSDPSAALTPSAADPAWVMEGYSGREEVPR